jgi:NAD(P)H dehydrogenase (quinone)
MADVRVLVVFYSRYGRAESLALAVGLGAIQAKGDIRLRRLADRAERSAIDADPAWKAAAERAEKDYVEPRAADVAWADALVLAAPAEAPDQLLEYIERLRADGSAAGKLAAPVVSGATTAVLARLSDACAAASMNVALPPAGGPLDAAGARAHGRRIVEVCRARSGDASR